MHQMNSCVIKLIVLLLLLNCFPGRVIGQENEAISDGDQGWVDMFPNSTLDGWRRTNTPPDTWSFDDGMLICSGRPIGEIRTARMYQNFILELEWRHMVPKGNAGIFIWADDITAKGVPFHRGIEVQVLEDAYGNTQSYSTHGDIFPIHGAKMTPVNGRGGSRAFPVENRSKPSPQWNHYRIECRDGEISLAVNGKEVTKGKECWPRRGYICLESEGGIVHYKNVRIKELPDTQINPADIAIQDRGYESIYSGLDLRGWKVEGKGSWQANDWVLSYRGNPVDRSQLTFESAQGARGFLFDFRCKASENSLNLMGLTGDALKLTEEPFKALLAGGGQWNRFELIETENGLQAVLNGQEVGLSKESSASEKLHGAAITLDVSGDTDFANLYLKN